MREPGIYYGLSNEDYHADRTALGVSGMKAILQAPAYYFGQYLDPNCPPPSERESAGRRFGSMVHCQLFEYPEFNRRYQVGPVVNSKAVKAWKDFAATLPDGCEGITPAEYACMQQVRRSVLSIPDMADALSIGCGEVSAYCVDDETGARLKVRPDWVYPVGERAVILLDGKTFASADGDEFSTQAGKMKYHMQAAAYSDVYAKASGKRVLAFIFLVIEDDYPHLANPVMLDERSMDAGRRLYRRAVTTYAECMRTGVWPGFGNDVKTVSLKPWHLEA
jgi:hypothetical protein